MPSSPRRIPRPTAQRLSLYARELQVMITQGQSTVSSTELGEKLGVLSAQIRKDLAWLGMGRRAGAVGRAGVGYQTVGLLESIRRTVGTNRKWSTALVGVGNIGRALLGYGRFIQEGCPITAILDADARLAGKRIGGLEVKPMSELRTVLRRQKIAIGIIAVPRSAAQSVATQLCDAGIQGILNFAPMRISVTSGVSVTSIDLSVALEQLALDISLRHLGALSGEGGR